MRRWSRFREVGVGYPHISSIEQFGLVVRGMLTAIM